jgi:PAS domain-containing protein
MEGRPQKHLALIIARELASQLATATFIADTAGDLVFYNEAAEEILGRTFAEAGTMSAEGWTSQFRLEELDGAAMPLERMPAGVALLGEDRPRQLWMTGLDGERRLISVTAVPLFASGTEVRRNDRPLLAVDLDDARRVVPGGSGGAAGRFHARRGDRRFGGNTPCVEVRTGDGALLILDAVRGSASRRAARMGCAAQLLSSPICTSTTSKV